MGEKQSLNDLLIRRLLGYMNDENIIVKDIMIIDKVCKFLKAIHRVKQNPNKVITLGIRDKTNRSETVMWFNHYSATNPVECNPILGFKDESEIVTNDDADVKPITLSKIPSNDKERKCDIMSFNEIISEHKDEIRRMNNVITNLVKDKTKLREDLIHKNKERTLTHANKVDAEVQTSKIIDMTPQYYKLMSEIVSVRSDLTRMLEPYDDIQFTNNLLDIGFLPSILKAFKYFTSKVEVKKTPCEIESDNDSVMDPNDGDDHECDSD